MGPICPHCQNRDTEFVKDPKTPGEYLKFFCKKCKEYFFTVNGD